MIWNPFARRDRLMRRFEEEADGLMHLVHSALIAAAKQSGSNHLTEAAVVDQIRALKETKA